MPLSFRSHANSNAHLSPEQAASQQQTTEAQRYDNNKPYDMEKISSYDGATLSATSSASSLNESEAGSTLTRKRDDSISRSNSMSSKLKGFFHKSPQNSSLNLPTNHSKSPSPEKDSTTIANVDKLDLNSASSGTRVTLPTAPRPAVLATAPPPITAPPGTARPEMKKTPSASSINGSLAKLKLAMPAVIENDLDEVLEEAERTEAKATTMSREPSIKDHTKAFSRGRKSITNRTDGTRSRSSSRRKEVLNPINSPSLSNELLERLKTVKHRKEGNLIVFTEDMVPHIHDFSKLKKDPIQTSPSGILSSLLSVKKKENNAQDHLYDNKLEEAISLLPDNYSEELILFKSKPENFRYNFENYLYGDGSSSDSSYESDSDYDSDEDIDPIIGDAQLDIINKLVDKIEHLDKYKERIQHANRMKLVEKYGKIQGLVGKGSYGVVKLAVKQLPNKTQRIFAIKELKQKSNESMHHFSNRLTSEFMISSSLTHQSIINTYDLMVDVTTHTYLQVMDYVPCGDLFALVQASNGEGLNPIESDCFFKQTLNAVSYLHSVGISHNDLKVENLLLTATGQLKIIDFGTSTPIKCAWENHCSKLSGPQGSEPYCGPEMFVAKDYDPRLADIWSLGVIYLVMANGGYGWKLASEKSDSAYKYYLESRPAHEGGKGSYDIIEDMRGSNKNSRKRVLYSMLDPNPDTRIRLKDIWKSQWVTNIEVCDAGKGLDPVVY